MTWKQSSFCGSNACVRVRMKEGLVLVRDTSETEVSFTIAEWKAFVAGVRAGEFDLPEHF